MYVFFTVSTRSSRSLSASSSDSNTNAPADPQKTADSNQTKSRTTSGDNE